MRYAWKSVVQMMSTGVITKSRHLQIPPSVSPMSPKRQKGGQRLRYRHRTLAVPNPNTVTFPTKISRFPNLRPGDTVRTSRNSNTVRRGLQSPELLMGNRRNRSFFISQHSSNRQCQAPTPPVGRPRNFRCHLKKLPEKKKEKRVPQDNSESEMGRRSPAT